VFESAWFKPQSVRLTSRRLGLRTEASSASSAAPT
jgi:phenylalanyl-tRNA synthetase beta subunit